LLMQFQADMLGAPVVRPHCIETTALGAAYAAGLATGVWKDTGEIAALWRADARWRPQMQREERDRRLAKWRKAVTRSLDWSD
jgi:glycerol kinase